MCEQTENTTGAKLYISIGVGSRDLFIDEAHTALDIFLVFFPSDRRRLVHIAAKTQMIKN